MITMKKRLTTLQEGKEEFITDCKIRNLTETSIKSYKQCFDYFIKYIEENHKVNNIYNDMTKKQIDEYVIFMKEKGLKDTTINIRLRSIRCVLYYFMEKGYIEKFTIKQIKETDKMPKLYNDEEIKKLLVKPNVQRCNFAEYRTWAIINFFIATGVRCRSLRNVKIKDLDFENELIYIHTTKNRKPIVLPMGRTIKKVLLEYLKIRCGELEDYVFCNLEGKQLTQSSLHNIVGRYNVKRGVTKTNIHAFRHYFAKNYIQNGGNALKLQKLLGHSTLEQTRIYVDLFGQDLQKDFDVFSPLDKLCANNERIKMRIS